MAKKRAKATKKTAKKAARKALKKAAARKATRKAARKVTRKAARKAPAKKAAPKAAAKAAKKTAKKVARRAAPKKAAPKKAAAPKRPPLKKAAVKKAAVKKAPAAKAPPPPAPKAKAAKPKHAARPAPIRGAIPSSLGDVGGSSSAKSGRVELLQHIKERTETSPAITAGDVDADWLQAYSSGDEAPGGDNPTPDQDIVDEIGEALGVEYDDEEELKGAPKIEARDKHRWELDPASKEDLRRVTACGRGSSKVPRTKGQGPRHAQRPTSKFLLGASRLT